MTRTPKTKTLVYVATISVVAVGLLILAVDNGFYSATVYVPQFMREPLAPLARSARFLLADPGWDAHDLVRKFYSLLAFGALGFLIAKALGGPVSRSRLVSAAASVTAFSTIIEIFQRLSSVHESKLSSILDVLCGALGGVIGYALHVATRRRPS